MQKEAVALELPGSVYLDLAFQLRKCGDMRTVEDVVCIAVKSWIAAHLANPGGRGYQWKDLFLPDGTELRMRYKRVYYYAVVERDELMYGGESFTPRGWSLFVTGTVRNPWRDIWIRRSVRECWTRASTWRTENGARAAARNIERRLQPRRCTD
jgi:hypothetical protein